MQIRNYSPLAITKNWYYTTIVNQYKYTHTTIANKYKYTAFGELKYYSGTHKNTHKFTGKELDGSGLYYYGARYYDKSLGRWLTPDPASMPSALNLNDPQTLNPYVYCTNNPIKFIDPNGLWRTLIRNNTAYVYRRSTIYTIAEGSFETVIPGGGLITSEMRYFGGDITVGAADWVMGGISLVPGLGTLAKVAIGGTGAIRGLAGIPESNQDRIKLEIYAKLTGNQAFPPYNLGDITEYKLGPAGTRGEVLQLISGKGQLMVPLMARIELFWKLMNAAGGIENLSDDIKTSEDYKEIYNAYLKETNKQ